MSLGGPPNPTPIGQSIGGGNGDPPADSSVSSGGGGAGGHAFGPGSVGGKGGRGSSIHVTYEADDGTVTYCGERGKDGASFNGGKGGKGGEPGCVTFKGV